MDVLQLLPGPINRLPTETLLELFQYISTTHLLHNCRLVSPTWNTIATSLCRKRSVRVKRLEDSKFVSGVCLPDTFKKDADLPWSAVELVFGDDPHHHKFCEQVFENFGAGVQRLNAAILPRKYNNFIRGLRHMPNLQVLKIWEPTCSDDHISRFVFPKPGKIQLTKLKHLEMDYGHRFQFIDLLNFMLLNTGATLTSLAIYGVHDLEEAEFQRMVELICVSNVQKLSLGVFYGRQQFVNWKLLDEHLSSKIVDLEILMGLRRDEVEATDNFEILQGFLAKCTGLHTLRLYYFDLNGRIPTTNLLKFPTLRHLKKLKIIMNDEGNGPYNRNPGFPQIAFSLLKPMDFPILENVSLKVHATRPLSIDIRKFFEPSGFNKFDTVKALNVGNYRGEGKLAFIFPNLTKITAIIQDSNQLSPIFDGMNNITEVDVTLQSNWDQNVLLKQAFGFIRCLKKLRKITLQIDDTSAGKALGTTGLDVLKYLQPVILIIQNAQVEDIDKDDDDL